MNFKSFIFGIVLTFFLLGCKPTNEQLLDKAYALVQQKKYEKAIDVYTRVIKNNHKIQAAYYYRGRIYLQLQNYEKALADFDNVMSLQSRDGLIFTYNKNGIITNEEIRTQIDYYDALYQRAQVKYYMDSLTSSFNDFETLVDKNLRKSNCLIWMGLIWSKKGDNDKACNYFKKSREFAVSDDDIRDANSMIKTNCKEQ